MLASAIAVLAAVAGRSEMDIRQEIINAAEKFDKAYQERDPDEMRQRAVTTITLQACAICDLVSRLNQALAEVAKLRACLPKWRKVPWLDDHWELRAPPDQGSSIGVCRLSDGWRHQHQSEHTPAYASRDAAMRAAEVLAGLPQCEAAE